MRLPAGAGLEWGRQYLIFYELITKNKRWPRNNHEETHRDKQTGVITDKSRRRLSILHKVDQNGNERRQCHLSQCRKEVQKYKQRKSRPDRAYKIPIERPKQARRLIDRLAHKWIDTTLKPPQHG